MVSEALSGCRGSDERATRALELLLERTAAESGYLYLVRDGDLDLAAPVYGQEPGPEITEAARRWATGSAEEETLEESAACLCVRLELRVGERRVIVGVAALRRGTLPLELPSELFLRQMARTLYEAGDAGTYHGTAR